jgi:PIN domain nuclease of toxin-antitoxin system
VTVLDAQAMVAYMRGEPARPEVARLLARPTAISAGNLAEVIDHMVRIAGQSADDVEADLATLADVSLHAVPVTTALAMTAGRLRARYYHRARCPVSMADCVAAAACLELEQPLATSDPDLAAIVRAEGGEVVALPDSNGRLSGLPGSDVRYAE